MNRSIKILAAITGFILLISGCKKVGDLPYYGPGTAVTLTASATSVAPTAADSTNQVVSFSWTSPEYATDSSTYKYILEIDSAGRNFAKAASKIVTGDLQTALTGKEINGILLDFGFALGTPVNLDFRIISSYSNNNERYLSNVVNVMITPYNDPSVLTTSNTSVTCALNTAGNLSNTFSWTNAFNGYSGDVSYVLQYDSATKNFANLHETAIGNNVFSKDMTEEQMNETALMSGVAGGVVGKIEYRIKATTALGAVSYSNTVSVTIQSYLPIVRFYMPGSYQGSTGNGNDWDPGTAPEFVRDMRNGALNRLYYMYIYLPAGTQFKITPERNWNVAYGDAGGGTLSTSGGNISVSTAGYYRISIDRISLQYDIREGRMGFVGGATGAGWNPPNVFPTYAMGLPSKNLFVGLTDFTADGWKLIDNDSWNNGSQTLTETRSYGSNGGSGSSMEINGANFPNITTPGRYRVIWDGRGIDDIKYEMSPATEMRVVGDGIQGVPAWDPGSSPQMTYMGNGVWTITINLIGNKDIKFLAGNAWGAFDYEDNSGGSQATGTPRKIKWEGGDNFKTPTTDGSYTITLNENAQTVTIN